MQNVACAVCILMRALRPLTRCKQYGILGQNFAEPVVSNAHATGTNNASDES